MESNATSEILKHALRTDRRVSDEDKGYKTPVVMLVEEKGKKKIKHIAADVLTKEEAAREHGQHVARFGSKNPQLN